MFTRLIFTMWPGEN